MKLVSALGAVCFFALSLSPATARPHHHQHMDGDGRYIQADRYWREHVPYRYYQSKSRIKYAKRHHQPHRRARVASNRGELLPHPVGCPHRAFCGCGVAVRVFGAPIRSLWLALEWVRKFPHTAPADGMVAARSGHAMYIEHYIGGPKRMALVYDPNSGRHETRRHERSLANYTIVDPHGAKLAAR